MFFLPIMICLALFIIAKFLTYTFPKHMENANGTIKSIRSNANRSTSN